MTLLLLFAFLSGIVTIFAPCIWPILPIILSAGVSGGERKPLGVVVGLMLSFTVFTLTLSYILKVVPIDPNTLRLFAVAMISFLGLVLAVPVLGRFLEAWVSRLSGLAPIAKQGNGFKGGFITGFALGLVWSPCAGPILATVATLAATQTLNLSIILVTVAFVLGVGIPLFIFALLGQRILTRTRALSPYTAKIQQAFGVIMILAALAIYTGYDQILQVRFANFCSAHGITFLEKFQTNEVVTEELNKLRNPTGKNGGFGASLDQSQNPGETLPDLGPAPEFMGIMNWLNVDQPLTLESLRGKVVLVDFWTYSCINCVRTLPFVTSWYEKYKDQGFVVVGVHTPEFEFEKKTANVADAIERYKIGYPVAQDNDFATWQAYSNQYWPAHYLIDVEGHVRQVHFGEGNYEETEAAIQSLLEEAGKHVEKAMTNEPVEEVSPKNITPETYLGSSRRDRFASLEEITSQETDYHAPESLPQDAFALTGRWTVLPERIVSGSAATLSLHFEAGKVFLVMGADDEKIPARVKVFLDDHLITPEDAGADIGSAGVLTVTAERLYSLVQLKDGVAGEHTLRLEFETPRTSAYAFTFGR